MFPVILFPCSSAEEAAMLLKKSRDRKGKEMQNILRLTAVFNLSRTQSTRFAID